jgi:hypothetical protein
LGLGGSFADGIEDFLPDLNQSALPKGFFGRIVELEFYKFTDGGRGNVVLLQKAGIGDLLALWESLELLVDKGSLAELVYGLLIFLSLLGIKIENGKEASKKLGW